MAPLTRNALAPPRSDLLSQNSRQASWQFVGSDMGSEREVSEEPTSSYDEGEAQDYASEEEEYDDNSPETPEEQDDILHPLREAANRVGREVERFAESLDEFNPLRAVQNERHQRATELIKRYHGVATDTLKTLHARHGRGKQQKNKHRRKALEEDDEMDVEDPDTAYGEAQTTLDDLERWEAEERTWDLMGRLAKLRFPSPDSSLNDQDELSPVHRFSSEKDTWADFLESDGLALERQTVLQWLKTTADVSGDDIHEMVQDLQQKADRGDNVAHGWIYTRATIKKVKQSHRWPGPLEPSSEVAEALRTSNGTVQLITQLDPDAMTRQKLQLEHSDESFARSISLGCYEMLRRGRSLEEIKDFCSLRSEIWRAVSMSGFPEEKNRDEDESVNPVATALWRRMCFALARNGGIDEFERATYGILSGDISSVEPVCKSWDDFVFAHYNALLRTQYDKYLQSLYSGSAFTKNFTIFENFDAVQFHGNPQSAGQRLIENLKLDPRTANESMEPLKMIQGALIANQVEHFVYHQGLALSKFANARGVSKLIPATDEQPENENINKYITMDDHDSLRVLTHMLIIFTALGLKLGGPHRRTVIENIIVAYINFLRLAGKEELIPLYCSQLTGNRRYATLSRSLIDVVNPEQRVTQIKLIKNLGLDAQEFVSYQSRYLLLDFPDTVEGYPATSGLKVTEADPRSDGSGRRIIPDFFGPDPDRIERNDMLLIRSLEWYLLVEGMWTDTFTFGTMIYMRFYKHMHLNAARKLAKRVRADTIAKSKTRIFLDENLDFEGLELYGEDEDLTEVLNGASNESKQLTKHLLAEAKSFRELEALILALDGLETVASYAELIEDNTTEIPKDWRQGLASILIPAKEAVQPLLHGWLLTSQEDVPEFQQLREAYLPETILAYVLALQLGGRTLTRDLLMETMELSTLIADEDSDLLALFVKLKRLPELVDVLTIASKALLITNAGQKKQTGSKGKKLRQRGWTPDIWSVKP
ncbi:107-domain-containing protein [Bisporella sp. PMI_857]|nr:107-domain-containing protein [Bisporella sp. PMI_857]